MARKKKDLVNDVKSDIGQQVQNVTNDNLFVRPVICVRHRKIDNTTFETEQGKAQTVQQLYQDFVLGKLDQSQLAGCASYDEEDSEEVDSFNRMGITLEETTQIADRGRSAHQELQSALAAKQKKQQDEAAQKQEQDLRAKILKEMEEKKQE